METIKATVENINDKRFIKFVVDKQEVKLPLSEDKPNEVKSAFNKLIIRIKKGEFQIELQTEESDLFCQVAKEYIKQLNREVKEVYGEMKALGLVKAD